MSSPDATLPDLLVARARGASATRLAVDVGAGVLVAAATLFWRPRPWPLVVCAALCFAAFGTWGIADCAAWRVLRGIAAVLGVLAAIGLALGIVAYGVGG